MDIIGMRTFRFRTLNFTVQFHFRRYTTVLAGRVCKGTEEAQLSRGQWQARQLQITGRNPAFSVHFKVVVTAKLPAHGPFPPTIFGRVFLATFIPALPATVW